jgi:hypothetical protein
MGALEDSVKILHGAGAYRVKEKDLKELADVMEKAHEKSYGGNIMYTGQKSGISGHIYWLQNSVFRSLRKQRYPFNYKMRKFFDDINEIFENKGTKKVLSYILKRFGTYLSD